MTKFSFFKYQGAGNDFILIDNRSYLFSCDPQRIQKLCDRHYGIGADGLILLEPSDVADMRMRIFNADASEAAMCGNGIRCLFDFARHLGVVADTAKIETPSGIYDCSFYQNKIKVILPTPSYSEDTGIVHCGVPHFVEFVKNLTSINVEKRGREIRFDVRFLPQGTNVTFAEVSGKEMHCRTYERGVERETLACGTGAVAAAFLARKNFRILEPITVVTPSKEKLTVFQTEKGIELIGPATQVFQGDLQ